MTETFSHKCRYLVEQIANQKKEMQARVIAMLPELYTELFKTSPGLNTIIIQGYTPSFCDGDPCTYHHNVMVSNDDMSDHGREDEEANPDLPEDTADYVRSTLESLEEVYQLVYGSSGYELTITRDASSETGYKIDVNESFDCGY